MKSFHVLMLCVVVSGLLATHAWAADDFVAGGKAVKRSLDRSREIIVELSDVANSDADKKVIARLVATQKKLEEQLAQYDKVAANATKASGALAHRTQQLNKAVRLYNSNCRGRRHSGCAKLRGIVEAERGKLKALTKILTKVRTWEADLKSRSGKWQALLEEDLKRVKKLLKDTGPLEELPLANAATFDGGGATHAETMSATTLLGAETEPGLGDMKGLGAVPDGLDVQVDEAPLAEESMPSAEKAEWVMKRVRVKRRFGPFCWTECCWRKVKLAK